jgi:hypothetical protein
MFHVDGGTDNKKLTVAFRNSLANGHKIYLKETGWEGMDWIKLARNSDQERNSVKTVKNRHVRRASATSFASYGSISCGE